MIGLENCVQLMSTRGVVAVLQTQNNKLNLEMCKSLPVLNRPSAAATLSSSTLSLNTRRRRKSSIVCKAKAIDEVQEVTDSSWDTVVITSEKPVLVEFWAPWCGPCRMIAPVVDDLAKEYAGKILCCKVNTDDSPNIATQYGIRSIPTVLFFKNGEKKESIIGAVPKSTLSTAVEKYLDG